MNKNCEDIILKICEHALSKQNLQIALLMCNNLIKYNYKEAWTCTKELAVHLINSKAPILSSLSSSSSQLLASIKRISTNIYNLNETDNIIESSDSEIYLNEISKLLSFSLTYCDNESLDEILLLQINNNNKMIKSSLNIYEDSLDKSIKLDLENIERNCSFENQNKNIDITACLLTELINFDKKTDEFEFNDVQFLKKVEKLLNLDLNLIISYLLQLNTRNEVYYIELISNNIYFQNNFSHEFLLYIIALTIMSKVDFKFDEKEISKSKLYFINLANLIKIVREIQDKDNKTDELQTKLFSLFTKIDNLYTESMQLNELNDLQKGIDINRFKNETTYKKETINGLAMDINTFDLACNLAKLNGLNLWDIYIVFIEYLFTEYDDGDESKLKIIEDYSNKLKPELLKDKDNLNKRVNLSILPSIDGKNIDKLILFYNLVSENEDLNELHVKLLKKIKQVNFEEKLNYKQLLDKPLETLNSAMNESTLQFFTKNATNLTNVSTDKSIKFTSSYVYSIFYLKKFHYWLDNSTVINETFQINEQFENLKEYLKKITIELDCMILIYQVIFHEKTIRKLSLAHRKEFLKRYLRLFKKTAESKSSTVAQFSYEDVYNYLIKIQEHLKLIENINGLLTSGEYRVSIDIELSKLINLNQKEHDFGALEDIFVDMLFNGYTIENLNQILLLIKQNNLTIKELTKNYFIKIFGFIERNEKKDENVEVLNKFLKILSTFLNKSSNSVIITQEFVMEYLRIFCNNTKIELKIRLNLLEYIKTLFAIINTDDLLLLIVYKTNAILEAFNLSVKSVNVSQISTEDERLSLFENICLTLKSNEECVGLINLLKIWPPFDNITEINSKPWNKVLILYISLINFQDVENLKFDLITLTRELKKDKKLNEYDIAHISNQILTDVKECKKNYDEKKAEINNLKLAQCFKLCFLYHNFVMINQLIDNIKFDLKENNNLFKNSNLDKLLFLNDEHAKNENLKLFLKFIETPLYNQFIDYLLNRETNDNIKLVVKILKENNHLIEASYLVSNLYNTHNQYNTISLSFALLEKFSV